MLRHRGGERVKAGFYFNMSAWEVTTVSGTGGELGGGESETWVRLPGLLVLAVAPLMGAAYVVFLPFVGIAMLGHHLLGRATGALRGMSRRVRLAETATGHAAPPPERERGNGSAGPRH